MDSVWQVTSLVYIVVLLVGGVFGAILKTSLDERNRKRVASNITTIAIYVLLPVHVFLSIVGAKSSDRLPYFLPLFISGAICCIFVLLVTHYAAKASQFRSHYDPHFKYVASTMGGGGRAVVLLAGVMPLLETFFPTGLLKQGLMLDIFAVFDFGYWIFFNAVIFGILMPMSFGTNVTREIPKLKEWGVLIAAGLGTVVQYFDWVVTPAAHEITLFLRFILTIAIVGLSTAGVVVNVGGSNFSEVYRDMRFIFIVRLIGLLLPMIVLPVVLAYYFGVSPLFAVMPIVLMLLLPPSSLVGQMLEEKGATADQVQAIANINVTWNLLLFIVVLLSIAAYAAVRWLGG